MPCKKHTMKWAKAMRIARREYPRLSLKRRRMITGKIVRRKK